MIRFADCRMLPSVSGRVWIAVLGLPFALGCGGGAPSPSRAALNEAPSQAPSAAVPTNAAPAPANAPVHLAVRTTEQTYWIGPAACGSEQGCPFVIIEADKSAGAHASLEWRMAFEPVEVKPTQIAATPGGINAPIPVESLITGEEERNVTSTVRPVSLAPGVSGVLVDQWAGFEHIKSAHFLFAPKGGKLEQVWRYEDGEGPTSSSTAVVELDAQHAGVLLVTNDGFAEYSDDPDVSVVGLLRWDDASKAVKEATPAAVRVAVLGAFPSVATARQARKRGGECLGTFAILPAGGFAFEGKKSKFVLASTAVDEASAKAVLQKSQPCAKGLKGSIATVKATLNEQGEQEH